MEGDKEKKRKKDRRGDDDDSRKEKKSKRARTRSRSPGDPRERDSRRKRRHSRSKSPERSVKKERQRDNPGNEPEVKSEAPVRKNKETDMLNTRTGGAYIPPARLRMMQAQITDKSSVAFQRLAWEALKKSIHGHINKINVGNIGIIIKQLLKENIVRGRGLLCRSVIQAQAASPTFTNVYAALVAAVNSRFPNIGELLLKRLVIQFKRGFKRNDKAICISSASFIAHLVNQRVAHEILALELLTLLVETPTDDSVEVAIAFLKECGQKLTEVSSKGVNAIFEMLRNILHEGQLDKRVQYMIEVMFQVWKDGFKDHPALLEELELVPEEEQFTHLLMLDDATDPQDILNVFKFDDKYEENEQKYTTLSKEILGSDAETDEEGSGESGSEESDDEEGEEGEGEQKGMTIIDNTETNLVALRRTIYLTINSSLDFEECAHKLMKMQLKPGQEVELCHMFLDCCAEQRTYEKFYGLLAQRFCNINRMYIAPFEQIFRDSYGTAHRLDTNRLRNVSKFFAHLLFTDSIGWEVLECVKLNEEDTTSSSRIYIKILFQELAEYMGLKKLNDRLKDPMLQEAFSGVFPRDNPKNTRFSINFFTSIGLGGLTDELREHLKQMPKNVLPQNVEINVDSSSDSSSSSSSSDSSSSDSSSSDSADEGESGKKKSKKKNKDKTPKTPEETAPEKDTERWGHDGFYDTYGKDARRTENIPERNKRDKDNFVIPRDVRRNDNRGRNRDDVRGQDNFWSGRRDDRPEESRRDSRGDDRRREDRNGDSNYRRDDNDRRRERSDIDRSRDRNDNERRNNERKDDERRDRNDRRGNDDDSRRKERNDDRDNSDRDRRDRNDDSRRDRHDDRSRRVESRSGEEPEESRSRREKDYRGRDSDEPMRDDGDYSRRNDKDRSRRNREDTEDKTSRDRRQEEVDRSTKKNTKHRRNDTESSESDQDKRKSDKGRRKEKSGTDEEEDGSRKNKNKKDSKRDTDSDDDDYRKKKKDKSSKHKDVSSSDEESEEDHSKNKKKKDKKNKNKEVSSSDTDSDEEQSKKKKNKSKSKRQKDDSSSDEQHEKENKHRKDKSRRDEDDERSRKKDKGKKKSVDEEGWDIRRASSLRRETPERYWKNK